MQKQDQNVIYTYQECETVPFNENEVIIETTPEEEIDVVYEMPMIEDEEEEERDGEYYMELVPTKPVSKQPHVRRRHERIDAIRTEVAAESIELDELGRSIVLGVAENSLTQPFLDRAVRDGVMDAQFLGDISMEALVTGIMDRDGLDPRYAMIGQATMWNVLKANVRDVRNSIISRSAQNHSSEPRFDMIDIDVDNIATISKRYDIRAIGVFANADLYYVFNMLTFRTSAKLLNKVKQFLKAYFIVGCRPRCMIWRYTLRRTGNTHKKTILNLPHAIVQSILNLLLDLTGIGAEQIPFEHLSKSTPFYRGLSEHDAQREDRYLEICQLRDHLISFFRDAIIDVLNEIREMPFCLATGTMVSPLRGKSAGVHLVTWKEYETLLKKEDECPSKLNIQKRVSFEHTLCEVVPRR